MKEPNPLIGRKETLQELQEMWKESGLGRFHPNQMRTFFENVLKDATKSKSFEPHSIMETYNEFNSRYGMEGFEYSLKNLIKELNKLSHSKEKLIPSEEKDLFEKAGRVISRMIGIEEFEFETIIENSPRRSKKILNDEQKEAISSSHPITLVDAGPGSGKTDVVVGRIIKTINENQDKKIVGISYTNQATNELKSRIIGSC